MITLNNLFFYKKTNFKQIIFFTHSVGGNNLSYHRKTSKKNNFKSFINYEGNLTFHDTFNSNKKTSLYEKINLVKIQKTCFLCENSDDIALKMVKVLKNII